jgi:hypothetical protein
MTPSLSAIILALALAASPGMPEYSMMLIGGTGMWLFLDWVAYGR